MIDPPMEMTDTSPAVNVPPAEYQRLLGYPRGREPEGRAAELAEWASEWYAKNGRPWVYAREAESMEMSGDSTRIAGTPFTGARLRGTLERAGAHSAILAAVGAGPEIEREAQKLWQEEKPDEYFFLEVFGSAVVEHLITMTGARLCAWAEEQGMAVLPHDSPGYPEWDIREQAPLLDLMRQNSPLLSRVEVLGSGALRPKKSLLAVFGLTRHTDRLRRLTELVPCQNCSMPSCQYRRAPYSRAAEADVALDRQTRYTVNTKALKKWAEERLTLEPAEDGGIQAVFRYEGTTCTNMGRPLAFNYQVKLGPPAEGYPIREQQCAPAPADTGHTFMCAYIEDQRDDQPRLMSAIAEDRPLLGQRLNDVLSWTRPACAAGCYCEPGSRQHRWGLVLETIHYALAQRARLVGSVGP